MKDFKDFKKYLNDNYSEELSSKTAELFKSELLLNSNSDNKDNLNAVDMLANICATSITVNTTMIFDILEKYHSWLEK